MSDELTMQILKVLKEFFDPKLTSIEKKIDDFIITNSKDHDNLYDSHNQVEVLKEQIKNQKEKIDTLQKWVVGAFSMAFVSLLGIVLKIIIK